MKSLRLILLAFLVPLTAQVGRAQAAVLLDEYSLRGTLADNLGGPSLTTVLFGGLAGAITPNGYVFGPDQGLMLINPALNATTYSIEFSVSLSATSGYRKLLDFKNRFL